jgi:hypothetical protein
VPLPETMGLARDGVAEALQTLADSLGGGAAWLDDR